MKTFNAQKFYRRIAEAAHAELHKVHQLTPEQLAALIKYTEGLSRTNCWWMEYQIRDIVSNEIRTSPKLRQVEAIATGEVR